MLDKTIKVLIIVGNALSIAFLGFTAYWLWSLSKKDNDQRERIAS